MLVLGIETSCDETAAAVVEGGRKICSNIIASQIDLHGKYGGVVPELACRRHLEAINPVVTEALAEASVSFKDLEGIAVTVGPGLVGALLVGIATAKSYAYSLEIPFVGVNHLEGHIYANFLEHSDLEFPFVSLVVSGGHTLLAYAKDHGEYELLGSTYDDAAGEAFDKTAKILELGYPGGPLIDRIAKEGDAQAIQLPRAYLGKNGAYNFSFSGLKTATLYYVKKAREKGKGINVADLAASFQQAIIEVLVKKTLKAATKRKVERIVLAGGVAANSALRSLLAEKAASKGIKIYSPSPLLCTDNAAMIASVGYYRLKKGERASFDLNSKPDLKMGD